MTIKNFLHCIQIVSLIISLNLIVTYLWNISAAVDNLPCFLIMSPIDCKITNFSSYLLVCFFIITLEKMTTTLSQCAPLILLIGRFFSQYTSYSPIFSPLHNFINIKQHECTSAINPDTKENTEDSLIKACTPTIDQWKAGVPLPFISSTFLCVSATVFHYASYWMHGTCTANRHLHKGNGTWRITTLGNTTMWCKHCSCCGWWKGP